MSWKRSIAIFRFFFLAQNIFTVTSTTCALIVTLNSYKFLYIRVVTTRVCGACDRLLKRCVGPCTMTSARETNITWTIGKKPITCRFRKTIGRKQTRASLCSTRPVVCCRDSDITLNPRSAHTGKTRKYKQTEIHLWWFSSYDIFT